MYVLRFFSVLRKWRSRKRRGGRWGEMRVLFFYFFNEKKLFAHFLFFCGMLRFHGVPHLPLSLLTNGVFSQFSSHLLPILVSTFVKMTERHANLHFSIPTAHTTLLSSRLNRRNVTNTRTSTLTHCASCKLHCTSCECQQQQQLENGKHIVYCCCFHCTPCTGRRCQNAACVQTENGQRYK